MRGTKERFAKYVPLLPQSQGITQPAVEPHEYDKDACGICGKLIGEHDHLQLFACAHEKANRLRAMRAP